MSGKRLHEEAVASLDIHPRILSALKRAGLSKLSSVLIYSAGDLARRTRLSQQDIASLIQAASHAVLPKQYSTTALHMHKLTLQTPNWGRLSTGCCILDRVLHGGLLVPGVSEIAGTSAAGKTQLCLQFCLMAQLPRERGGLNGGAVYICTEDAFPNKRFHQLADSFAKRHSDLNITTKQILDSVYVEHAATISSLSVQLQYKLPSLLCQQEVKLVVIDSLAALFRVEFSGEQAVQRAQLLRAFGAQMRRISEEFSVPVICVNQVTAAMSDDSVHHGGSASGIKPALGLAWADMVTVRLMLTRGEAVESEAEYQQNPAPTPRTLQVLLAPHLPQTTIQYYIDVDGVHGLEEQVQNSSSMETNSTK